LEKIRAHKFFFLSLAYWVLLLYAASALVFWCIELEKQNLQMYDLRYELLKKNDPQYQEKLIVLNNAKYKKTAQYLSEGFFYFVLILAGAAYVYRAMRQQIIVAQQQQNFLMAVTHEFKTPIAVARLNLETMQKRKLQPEQQEKLINNTLIETDRLNNLTTNILVVAQLEGGNHKAFAEIVDISKMLKNCLHNFSTRYQNRKFISRIEDNIQVKGDAMMLELLVNNLLSNALKYSSQADSITLNLFRKNKNAVIEVIDEGFGIGDSDKKKIFRKFYRVGNELVRKTKGTGIGLYLCKKIVKDCNGNIEVSDNQPKGSNFTVRIPALNFKNDDEHK
jgi:signal transduction histidine kinase